MRDIIQISRKEFYIVVGFCAAIIILNSIDAMFKVKDLDMFDFWLNNINPHQAIGETREEMYHTYLTMCLSNFFVRIITPIGFSLHTYYALLKTGINKSYVWIWSILLIASLVFSILGEKIITIFLIATGIGYIGLFIALYTLHKKLRNARML